MTRVKRILFDALTGCFLVLFNVLFKVVHRVVLCHTARRSFEVKGHYDIFQLKHKLEVFEARFSCQSYLSQVCQGLIKDFNSLIAPVQAIESLALVVDVTHVAERLRISSENSKKSSMKLGGKLKIQIAWFFLAMLRVEIYEAYRFKCEISCFQFLLSLWLVWVANPSNLALAAACFAFGSTDFCHKINFSKGWARVWSKSTILI